MADWTKTPPAMFDVVTGFFPEVKPKHNWTTNPRPILVTGVFRKQATEEFFIRVAYGTSQIHKIPTPPNLCIGNLSSLDSLNLARPTAFVIAPGSKMMILPWSKDHFRPWRGFASPSIGKLPQDMAAYVKDVISHLEDLPMPGKPSGQ